MNAFRYIAVGWKHSLNLFLSLFCTQGILFAAEPSISAGALPPTIYALAEPRENAEPGTVYFYFAPRGPATAMAIFSTKEAAEAFVVKLAERPDYKLTPYGLKRSFLQRSFLRASPGRRCTKVLLDPVNATEGGTPVVEGTSTIEESDSVLNPGLRNELLERGKRDQEIRFEMIRHGNVEQAPAELRERTDAIDKENRERMREIIHQYGWPGPELVGEDGTQSAWIVVQHADLEFQKQCLPLVKEAYLAGKLPGGFFALLQDRVLVGEGKPQIYGSQTMPVGQWKNGQPVFEPIQDEQNVDKRRAEVGLQPLADYIESLKALYLPHGVAGSTGSGDRAGSAPQDGKAGVRPAPSRGGHM
jgi:hypothetical protein